jgi:hypothetical protein
MRRETISVRIKYLFLGLTLIFVSTFTLGQAQDEPGKESIYVVVKDIQGGKLEGYVRSSPAELIVSTKDNQEKSVPLKQIEFIKLEKIHGRTPGGDQAGGEAYYSVKLQNSQEIYTLNKKYTLSLNTSLGLVTQIIDAEAAQRDKPFIRDTNVVLSLEFKF